MGGRFGTLWEARRPIFISKLVPCLARRGNIVTYITYGGSGSVRGRRGPVHKLVLGPRVPRGNGRVSRWSGPVRGQNHGFLRFGSLRRAWLQILFFSRARTCKRTRARKKKLRANKKPRPADLVTSSRRSRNLFLLKKKKAPFEARCVRVGRDLFFRARVLVGAPAPQFHK